RCRHFCLLVRPPPPSPLFPYTTLFRSGLDTATWTAAVGVARDGAVLAEGVHRESRSHTASLPLLVERVLGDAGLALEDVEGIAVDRKSTRLNSSHVAISYAVFCLKKKN